jgi:hypothetical protein
MTEIQQQLYLPPAWAYTNLDPSGDHAYRPLAVRCEECHRLWFPANRWRCYLDDENNPVSLCPECAEREFGDTYPR